MPSKVVLLTASLGRAAMNSVFACSQLLVGTALLLSVAINA